MALDPTSQMKAILEFAQRQGADIDLISPFGASLFFHYTDYNAFASIVTKKDLWLTDARCSNDAEEIEHGRKRIKELIEEQALPGNGDHVHRLACDVANLLNAQAESELKAQAVSKQSAAEAVYVCCFCKDKGDLLSQWRGYAAGGGGVAVEIDPYGFSQFSGTDNRVGVMGFWKVYYEDNEKRRKVGEILNFWRDAFDAVVRIERETTAARGDFLVERRGFKLMAIAA